MAHLTLHHVFDWRLVNVHSFTGWMIIVAVLFNALAASTYLMALVRYGLGVAEASLYSCPHCSWFELYAG